MRQWYAPRSKPKKERLAAILLTRAGIESYLPQLKIQKMSAAGRVQVLLRILDRGCRTEVCIGQLKQARKAASAA